MGKDARARGCADPPSLPNELVTLMVIGPTTGVSGLARGVIMGCEPPVIPLV